MKRIKVNTEACIGCGACVAVDPEHFAFNDEGLSHSISTENLDSSELKSAMDTCPTSAISFVDGEEETAEENEECDCDHCEGCHHHEA